jgi:hypothetical protein
LGADIVRDTLFYYCDYTEWDMGEMTLNAGWNYGLGLSAMTEIDSVLKVQIKSYGFDTAIKIQKRDRIVVDSIYNKFLLDQNDSAIMLLPKLSINLLEGSNILKIRLKVVLPGRATSGLGFYNDGLVLGGYLGIFFGIQNGVVYNLNTVQASPHLFMRNSLFSPQRSRNFLDRILK